MEVLYNTELGLIFFKSLLLKLLNFLLSFFTIRFASTDQVKEFWAKKLRKFIKKLDYFTLFTFEVLSFNLVNIFLLL